MTRKSLVLIALLGVAFNFEMSFSEYNILYHFDNLDQQFTYLDPEVLKYEKRLENNIKTLKEMKSDLMFIVEYDNNRNSGAYLNSQEVLTKQLTKSFKSYKKNKNLVSYLEKDDNVLGVCKVLKEILAPESFTVPYDNEKGFNKIIESLSKCKDLLNGTFSKIPKEEKDKAKKDEIKLPAEELAIIGEHLWKKFYTLQHSKGLFLNDEGAEKYRFIGVDKKCGTVLRENKQYDGYKDPEKKTGWPGCNFDDIDVSYSKMLQSNVVIYNTEKLELISKTISIEHDGSSSKEAKAKGDKVKIGELIDNKMYPTVFSMMDGNEKDSKPFTQNFAVYLFKYKEEGFDNSQDKRGLIFIGAHFKSKKDGFDGRQKMGEAITAIVTKLRKELPKWDVILSGDLNAEIEEIAKNLNEPIIRLEDQMVNNFGYKIRRVYTPKDFAIESVEQAKQSLEEFSQFKEFRNKIFGESELAQKMNVEALRTTPEHEPEKMNLKDPYLSDTFDYSNHYKLDNYWIELNNFPTEAKARVKEYDYTEHGFDECFRKEVEKIEEGLKDKSLVEKNIDKTKNEEPFLKIIADFRASNMYRDIFEMILEESKKKDKVVDKVGDEIKGEKIPKIKKTLYSIFLEKRKQWMSERKNQVHKILKRRISSLEWVALTNRADEKEKAGNCFTRLFEEEKIDFVLIKPSSKITSVKVEKMADFDKLLKLGFPNKDFASDHVPTKVTLTFDLTKDFKLMNPIFEPEPKNKLI